MNVNEWTQICQRSEKLLQLQPDNISLDNILVDGCNSFTLKIYFNTNIIHNLLISLSNISPSVCACVWMNGEMMGLQDRQTAGPQEEFWRHVCVCFSHWHRYYCWKSLHQSVTAQINTPLWCDSNKITDITVWIFTECREDPIANTWWWWWRITVITCLQ